VIHASRKKIDFNKNYGYMHIVMVSAEFF